MDVPDWAQDTPNVPDWASDQGSPDSGGIRLSNQPINSSSQPSPQPNTQQKPGVWEGVKRGAQQFDIGSRQLSSDLLEAVGIPVDPSAKQALNQGAQTLNKQGEGTGLAGWAGETLGSPSTYIPGGSLGKGAKAVAKGLTQLGLIGAESAATAPSEDDQGLAQRGVNSAEAGGLSASLGPVAHYAAKGIGSVGKWASDKTGLSDLITNIGEKLGAKPTGSDIYEMAKQTGIPTDGKSAEQIYNDLQNWHSENVDKAASYISPPTQQNTNSYIPKGVIPKDDSYDPLKGMADISQNYGATRQQSNDLYNQARFHGEGKTVEVNGLQNQLSGAVNYLNNKQFRTASEDAALSRLQEVQNNLGTAPPSRTATIETGTTEPTTGFFQSRMNKPQTTTYQPIEMIGYNNLVDLKQALNEGFNGSKFAGKGDRPIAGLFNNVKDALGRAAEQDKDPATGFSPFGDALNTADRHYSDELAPTYLNDTLSKFWKPEDHYDYITSQGWSRRAPNVDTSERANKMMDGINSPEKLQALTQAMSPPQASELSAQWFKNTMDKAGLDGDEISKNYDTLRSAAQGNKPALQLLDNIKTGVDAMNARGIGDNARFFDQSNPDIMKNAVLGAAAIKAGRPLYALKSILNVLNKRQGTAVERRINGFASDINAGAPSNELLTPAVNAIGTQAGKQTAIQLGEHQNQPSAHIDINRPNSIGGVPNQYPPYARGGRVNKYGKAVGILRD